MILFFGIILFFSMVSFFATSTAFMVTNEIYHGVVIGDLPVGGLTPAEAEAKIRASFQALSNKPLVMLEYNGSRWALMTADIEFQINAARLVQEAYAVGRTGNILQQLKERYITLNRGSQIPLAVTYDARKLHTIVNGIAQQIERAPRNAALRFEGSHPILVPEEIGLQLDTEKLLTDIALRINNQPGSLLPLPVSEIAPAIRNFDLAGIDTLIASFSTEFDSSDINRSQNIYLAAKSISGALVKAGQEFSFNTLVGPRLAHNGYKEAPVFIEGKLVPDYGGGVCQVSSTLYNAVLLADMMIIERTPHFRPPLYVPLGQDATVADNLLDFKFKNTSSGNIYINCETQGNHLTVFIYGQYKNRAVDIRIVSGDKKEIEPATIIKQDPELELGKQVVEVEGQKGFQVATYRVKLKNGQEIQRELLAFDEYKPVDHIIRVGTKTTQHIIKK
ncbi:MAG: VanW family protein [Negativicutes bacterium]|nr:VanW family protein [Negativicutes bacterium]